MVLRRFLNAPRPMSKIIPFCKVFHILWLHTIFTLLKPNATWSLVDKHILKLLNHYNPVLEVAYQGTSHF